MQDRIPATGREGWVKLTQADGTVIEGKLEMNDNATVLGTPLNKETLLADEVAEMFGLPPASATVSQALKTSFEMALGDRTLISVTVMTEDGFAIPGVAIQLSGEYYFTDENGMVNFDLAADGSTSYTFDLLLPWDLQSLSQTQIVTGPIQQGTVNRYTVTGVLKDLEDTVEIEFAQSASNVYFSGLFSVQKIWGCGGGGSGGISAAYYSNSRYYQAFAAGGAGGKTSLVNGISGNDKIFNIKIGAGGSAVTLNNNGTYAVGKNGGTTSVVGVISGNQILSAPGGQFGSSMCTDGYISQNGASGGSGSPGSDLGTPGQDGSNATGTYGGSGQGTTTRKFGEAGNTLYCSAANSIYAIYTDSATTRDGAPGAGDAVLGRGGSSSVQIQGGNATTYGSGGGSAVSAQSNTNFGTRISGAGMQGVVFIRITKVVTAT